MAGLQLSSTEYHSSRTAMPSACVSKTLCSKNNDLHKKDRAQVGGTLKTQYLFVHAFWFVLLFLSATAVHP